MKKIFLTGILLILLILLAVDFYSDRNRNNDQKNTVTSSTANTTNAADNTLSPATIAPDNSANDMTGVPAATTTPRQVRKTTRVTPVDNSDALAMNEPQSNIYSAEQAAPIAVEEPKNFYGNKPVEKTVSVTKTVTKTESSKHMLPVGLGLEIGYNQNLLYNNKTSNLTSGNVNVGLLYNMNFGDHFALQPGLKYITKGNRLQDPEELDTKEKLSLHYLEVPVNAIFKFGHVGDARFMVGVGPYVAYMVGSKDKFQTPSAGDGDVLYPATPAYSTNNLNKFDWGVNGFIGIQSPEGLFAKAGGEVGFMDVTNNTTNRNYNIMLSIGYILGGR